MIPHGLNKLGINYLEDISKPPAPEKILYTLNLFVKDNLTNASIIDKVVDVAIDGISLESFQIVNDHIVLSVYDYRFPISIAINSTGYFQTSTTCNLPETSTSELVFYAPPNNPEIRDQLQNSWVYVSGKQQDFDSHFLVLDNDSGNTYQCASYPTNQQKLYANSSGSFTNSSGETLILSASRDGTGGTASTCNEGFISKNEISAYNLTIYPIIYDWTHGNSGKPKTSIFYDRNFSFSITDNSGITYNNYITDPTISGYFWIVGKINAQTDEIVMFQNKIAGTKSDISVVCPEITASMLSALKLASSTLGVDPDKYPEMFEQ